MTILKILSLLAVLPLSYISVKQEKIITKWFCMGLCFFIFIVGAADAYFSAADQDLLKKEFFRDSSRIDWRKTSAYIQLSNEFEDVPKGAQQLVLKIVPKNIDKVGDVSISDILKRAEKIGKNAIYLNERDARKLWLAMAEPDGSIFVDKETALGIEHIYFHESELKDYEHIGVGSTQKVEFEPRAGARYSSLSDLNDTIVIARFATGVKESAVFDRVELNLRSNAGLTTLVFLPRQSVGGRPNRRSVRYVGLVLPKDEFVD